MFMNDKKKLHKYKLMNILSNVKNDKILSVIPSYYHIIIPLRIFLFLNKNCIKFIYFFNEC